MRKNYEELLERQSKKNSVFFAIVDKESFINIIFFLGVMLLIGGVFFINFKVIISPQDSLFVTIATCLLFSMLEIMAVIAVIFFIYNLIMGVMATIFFTHKLIKTIKNIIIVEIPVLLNRRYLPLTEEEIIEYLKKLKKWVIKPQ